MSWLFSVPEQSEHSQRQASQPSERNRGTQDWPPQQERSQLQPFAGRPIEPVAAWRPPVLPTYVGGETLSPTRHTCALCSSPSPEPIPGQVFPRQGGLCCRAFAARPLVKVNSRSESAVDSSLAMQDSTAAMAIPGGMPNRNQVLPPETYFHGGSSGKSLSKSVMSPASYSPA